VNYSSAANSQFGSRWHESNSGHNEENLQREQQQVHDRSPMFTVDHLRRPQSDPKKNAFRSRTIMIEASGDLFPARSSLDHALEHVMWNNAN
jgi:hypothetical protein